MTWVLTSSAHLALLVALACVRLVAGSSLLNTTLGQLQGLEVGVPSGSKVNIFYGVPFAKPPVGSLRFKRPLAAEPWTDTRDATSLPSNCWQVPDKTFNDFHGATMWNPNSKMSEDCLYLNIWQPVGGAGVKAILVWIFGGGFWSGSSTLDVYNATALAGMNDVIVVSMNYRLGPLGFLYTGGADAPGNAGLMDQQMALQWVYDNADRLGGDRSRITIFGESAGGASVGLHLMSPGSRDLFTNAVLMSAAPTAHWVIQDHQIAKERATKLAANISCSTSSDRDMMRCLLDIGPSQDPNVEQFSLVDNQFYVASGTYFDPPFSPVVDGVFLTDTPQNLLKNGKVKSASLITGVVHDEGSFWLMYGFKEQFQTRHPSQLTSAEFSKVTSDVLKPLGTLYQQEYIKTMTKNRYYDSVPPSERTTDMYSDALDDISGDTIFKCPLVDFTSEYVARTGSDVYQYSFEYRLSNQEWPAWLGVAHGYELEAFFGIPFLNDSYSNQDREVSRKVMEWLTQFAKSGVPGDSWPAYTKEEQQYLQIHQNALNPVTVAKSLRYRECTFWNHEVPSLASLGLRSEGDCVNGAKVTSSTSILVFLSSASVSVLYKMMTRH